MLQKHPGEQLTPQRRAPKFVNHVKAHRTVIKNEAWYGDGDPFLGDQFTAERTIQRCGIVIEYPTPRSKKGRKAKNKSLSSAYKELAKRLEKCRPNARCGSLACPECARASRMQRSRPKNN